MKDKLQSCEIHILVRQYCMETTLLENDNFLSPFEDCESPETVRKKGSHIKEARRQLPPQ